MNTQSARSPSNTRTDLPLIQEDLENKISAEILRWTLRICDAQDQTLISCRREKLSTIAKKMPQNGYLLALVERTNAPKEKRNDLFGQRPQEGNGQFFVNLRIITRYLRSDVSHLKGLEDLRKEVQRNYNRGIVPLLIEVMIEFGFSHLKSQRTPTTTSEATNNVTQLRPTAM